MQKTWRWPVDHVHHVAGTAGGLTFVGGAGDFDDAGRIRNPGDIDAQIAGAFDNVSAALAGESCTLADVVRVKVFYSPEVDDWEVIAKLARHLTDDPLPAISSVPEPLQPFDGQLVQVQVIASRGWRQGADIRVAERPVPAEWRELFQGRKVTGGLRAGEFIALSNRTAADDMHRVADLGDGPAQSHRIMEIHERTLAELGASPQDSVKMEG